jgi:hypothetical protein
MLNRQEFYGSEEFKNFISKNKESGLNFVPDGEQVFAPGENRDINYDEVYNRPFISFSETVADKSHHDFLKILEKDSDDFLAFFRCRVKGPYTQFLYSRIVSELVIFTALRYHEDKFDAYIRKLNEGMHPRYLMMGIAKMRGDYTEAFKKKGKSKKKE